MFHWLEVWLFAFCVRNNLMTTKRMDRWLDHLRKSKITYNGTLYVSNSLWGAKISHPNALIAHSVDQILVILAKNNNADIAFLGEYNEIVKKQLKVINMKEIHELF